MKNLHTYVPARRAAILGLALALTLGGCGLGSQSATDDGSAAAEVVVSDQTQTSSTADGQTASATTTANVSSTGVIDTTDMFTDRDLEQVADTSEATTITLGDGQDVQIDQAGVYVISGQASDVTIVVDVDAADKVQLVLDGASISNADFPCIYVKSADKVFVTTTQGTTNVLEVTGSFVADGDTNTDAAIFSRDDLVLNGLGTLQVSSTDNGISTKDDLKITGGTYQITSTGDGLEAHDSVCVADGDITISSQKDAIHVEDDEDDTVGYAYVCGGTLSIQAADDGIHATTYLQVDGGTLTIEAGEGLEATYVQLNGGTTQISATDDGVNATTKSQSVGTPTIEITGGELTVSMGNGDTDALDANGNIYVSGGTVDITAQFAFDFDGEGRLDGGTVTVNGEQVSEISNSMMMGGGMGGGPMGGEMGGDPMGGEMGGGPMGGGPQASTDTQTMGA